MLSLSVNVCTLDPQCHAFVYVLTKLNDGASASVRSNAGLMKMQDV